MPQFAISHKINIYHTCRCMVTQGATFDNWGKVSVANALSRIIKPKGMSVESTLLTHEKHYFSNIQNLNNKI